MVWSKTINKKLKSKNNDWEVVQPQNSSSSIIPGQIGIWKFWFLRRGENLEYPEKNLSEHSLGASSTFGEIARSLREQHAIGDANARGGERKGELSVSSAACSLVLLRLASLSIIGELARWLLGAKEKTNTNPHMASTPVFEPGPHWWDYCPTLALPKLGKWFCQSEDTLNIKSTNQTSEPIHRTASYPGPPRDFRPQSGARGHEKDETAPSA